MTESPAYQRLLAAADKANIANRAWMLTTIRDVYQLAVRWQGVPGREDAAAELLALLDIPATPPTTEGRADGEEATCDAVPPPTVVDAEGRTWTPGDCWCTLPPGHQGEHRCEPCTERHGAPGWTDPAGSEEQR